MVAVKSAGEAFEIDSLVMIAAAEVVDTKGFDSGSQVVAVG